MDSNIWINRSISGRLTGISRSRPALLLTGARQSGKSSLLRREFPEAEYISFDHPNQVEAATDSPGFFLDQLPHPVILDEIQYVPHLLREIKIRVDEDRRQYGNWLLTGSQKFELMETISESLAGRISIIHLETLSARELRNSTVGGIGDFIWKGGYPEIWSNPALDMGDFFESYMRTYVERDLKSILEVKNLSDFQRFVRVLATRIGQLVNYRDISKAVGVSDVTIKKWLHALQIGGLVYFLIPFYSNIGKRLVKSPKLYFADHGLACYLLGIESMAEWNRHVHRGNLWENVVLMELIKTNSLTPGMNIFFYRDQNGVEVDFVAEYKGILYFIEAKSGERIQEKKLNFIKVKRLFEQKHRTKAILFQNIPEKTVIRKNSYSCMNPLLGDFNL